MVGIERKTSGPCSNRTVDFDRGTGRGGEPKGCILFDRFTSDGPSVRRPFVIIIFNRHKTIAVGLCF